MKCFPHAYAAVTCREPHSMAFRPGFAAKARRFPGTGIGRGGAKFRQGFRLPAADAGALSSGGRRPDPAQRARAASRCPHRVCKHRSARLAQPRRRLDGRDGICRHSVFADQRGQKETSSSPPIYDTGGSKAAPVRDHAIATPLQPGGENRRERCRVAAQPMEELRLPR